MSEPLSAGPAALGLELSPDARVSDDGWLERELHAPAGLDGPPGILQGGLAAGITAPIARLADRHHAPLTSIDARLHAPTPLGASLRARVRASADAARYHVETRHGDVQLVSAEVELAGHEPTPQAFDLAELGRSRPPEPTPQHIYPGCFVCGPEPTHPHGQRLHPRYRDDGAIVQPWVVDPELGDERSMIDPLMISAVLDCPTVWASIGHIQALGHEGALLAGYRLQLFRDAPVMEPLRLVARMDAGDGRKIQARGALVDEEGVIYAVASAFHVSVSQLPGL